MATQTDHSEDIKNLRENDDAFDDHCVDMFNMCADLLEMHDKQSLSLDNWSSARKFIEFVINHPIQENHA